MSDKQSSTLDVSDDGAFSLRVNWSDDVESTYDGGELSPIMRGFLAVDRLRNKLHDAHAGVQSVVKARAKCDAVWSQLLAGIWDKRKVAGAEKRAGVLDIPWEAYLDALSTVPLVIEKIGADRAKIAEAFKEFQPQGSDGRTDAAQLRKLLSALPTARKWLEANGHFRVKESSDTLSELIPSLK